MKQVQTYKIVKDGVQIIDGDYIERFELEPYMYTPSKDNGLFRDEVKVERAKIVEVRENYDVTHEAWRALVVSSLIDRGYQITPFNDKIEQRSQIIEGTKHLAIFGITPDIEEAICGQYKNKITELKYDIDRMEKSAKTNKEWYDHYKKTADDFGNRIAEYNDLPWYKRIWRKI